MKINLTTVTITAVLAGFHMVSIAQNSAVSIIFTNPDHVRVIDTVIADQQWSDLLSEHDLSEDNIHLIRLNQQSMEIEGEKHRKVIEVNVEESSTSDGEDQKEKKMIWVEVDDASDLDLEEVKEVTREVRVEKIVESDAVAEDGEVKKEVRIEKTIENGEERTRAWVNGEEVSEEEAEALMPHKKTHISSEREMIFIESGSHIKGDIGDEHHHRQDNLPKAVVIINRLKDEGSLSAAVPGMSESLKLYPNPATNETTLDLEGVKGAATITITDLEGRVVRTMKRGDLSAPINVNLENFNPGTYIISVSHDEGMVSQTLIKQ